MTTWIPRAYAVLRGTLIAATLVAAAGAFAYVTVPWPRAGAETAHQSPTHAEEASLRRRGTDEVIVPDPVARRMGLQTAAAVKPTRAVKLPSFQGCLALDSNELARVRSRFAGEVVSLATQPEPAVPSSIPATPRPLQSGDRVKKGDLLAVVWSKDLGEKKSELVDAVSRLRTDEVTLRRLEDSYQNGSVPERSVLEARRTVEADRVATERAERTLRAWKLTDDEIAAVRADATKLAGKDRGRLDDWARVEVRAPRDGVLLEKNLAVGDVIDTTMDLFKVADLSHLVVWAHVYEEDLPLLQGLPRPVPWAVRLPARPDALFLGTLGHVGEIIDANQHTALVRGRIDNPEGLLKVGQYVTVTVEVPPPAGEVELPTAAVVEDGRESVVFVGRGAGHYTRRAVHVVRRLKDVIYVRDEPAGVHAGEAVVTRGALLLHEAMELLPKDTTERVSWSASSSTGPSPTR